MQQNTNLEAFDDWMSWKDNAYTITLDAKGYTSTPRHLNNMIVTTCVDLGLRPTVDFQVTMYEVRFRTKTFLAMFKMNYNNE
jgi:hypothetical protein|tara:strand:- start:1829 stop:2074 length:246 start_codon:yes stop_codon:yes gene_type:complete